ncbi:response regulator transcription factor [Spirulina subsalsa FACHB-351]|uniref:Response regulator transcription factor n=1 Tax=Spirulina subsalsa FACHB-351 TaxID=234711 RepID=A0ABT3L9H9_9CYAN|nr:response regulator transcription factor [Spirulina subsalsa]MCW6037615.1 response regulator transcription factor [Spirulina subsalsa FACHB-351]
MVSCQTSSLRVLIADDHELTRFSLKLMFSMQENIKLVGVAENGAELVELVKTQSPDVVVLDLQMPVMDGLTASQIIKQIQPNIALIAYTSFDDPQLEVMSKMANIDAVCSKDTPTAELLDLIRSLTGANRNQTSIR